MTRLWWLDPSTVPIFPERLSPEDRAQYARFIPDRKRHEFLCTRLLVKHVLGDERLTTNAHGRPLCVDHPQHRFNITHTEGLILLLESDEHEVGIDVELLSRAPTLLRLAPNVFAPRELADLNALPEAERAHRAVTLWTLKESYIKARGLGLALSLQGFAFRFDEPITRLDASDDDGARWQFETFAFGAHLVSTAIDRPAGTPVRVARHQAVIA